MTVDPANAGESIILPGQITWAMRVWYPRKPDRERLWHQLREPLASAFEQFRAGICPLTTATLNDLWLTVAHTMAQGYLAFRERMGEPGDLVEYVQKRSAERLCEVVWLAACHRGDDEASRKLLDMINTEVWPLAKSRASDRYLDPAIHELPGTLFESSRRGFNRGMPKLMGFTGESSLRTWLITLTVNAAIGNARRRDAAVLSLDVEQQSEIALDAAETVEEDAAQEPGDTDCLGRLQALGPEVLRQLDEQLGREAPRQQQYLRLKVRRHDTQQILQLLGVGKSQATELSQKVCSKFVSLLLSHDEEMSKLATHQAGYRTMTPAQRRTIEQWLGTLLAVDEPKEVQCNDS